MNYQQQLKEVPSLKLRKLKDNHEHYRALSSQQLVKAILKELQRRNGS